MGSVGSSKDRALNLIVRSPWNLKEVRTYTPYTRIIYIHVQE